MGYALVPVKYPHQQITIIALVKRILKMAQLAPLVSRRGIFTGSLSMVVDVGVTVEDVDEEVGVEVEVEDIGSLDDEKVAFSDVGTDIGTKELAGLAKMFWAGPITCR
jgi:hypothetical protein